MASTCKHCGGEIVWIELESGKLMPCNPRGITVITPDGKSVRGRESHFSTCPESRKSKQREHPARTLFN